MERRKEITEVTRALTENQVNTFGETVPLACSWRAEETSLLLQLNLKLKNPKGVGYASMKPLFICKMVIIFWHLWFIRLCWHRERIKAALGITLIRTERMEVFNFLGMEIETRTSNADLQPSPQSVGPHRNKEAGFFCGLRGRKTCSGRLCVFRHLG